MQGGGSGLSLKCKQDYASVQHYCGFLHWSSGHQSNHLCIWLGLTLDNSVTDLENQNPTGGEDAIDVTYEIKGLCAKARKSEVTGFSGLQLNIWRRKLRQMLKISRGDVWVWKKRISGLAFLKIQFENIYCWTPYLWKTFWICFHSNIWNASMSARKLKQVTVKTVIRPSH